MEVLKTIEEVFSYRLKEFRGPLTQADLADKLGVSVSTVARWETGTIPQQPMRAKIAIELGRPETAFFLDPDLSAPTAPQIAAVLAAALEKESFQRDLADLLEDYMAVIRRKT